MQLEPGIHHGLPNHVYHADWRLSSTTVAAIIKRAVVGAIHGARPQNAGMNTGTVLHGMLERLTTFTSNDPLSGFLALNTSTLDLKNPEMWRALREAGYQAPERVPNPPKEPRPGTLAKRLKKFSPEENAEADRQDAENDQLLQLQLSEYREQLAEWRLNVDRVRDANSGLEPLPVSISSIADFTSWIRETTGREVITASQVETAARCHENVRKALADLIPWQSVTPEVSFVTDRFRARPDGILGNYILSHKTARGGGSFGWLSWLAHARGFGYPAREAFAQDIVEEVLGVPMETVWLIVCTDRPYEVMLEAVPRGLLEHGRALARKAVTIYEEQSAQAMGYIENPWRYDYRKHEVWT